MKTKQILDYHIVTDLAALQNYSGPNATIHVLGRGGFAYLSGSTLSVNNVTVVGATGKGGGRWVSDAIGRRNLREFGVVMGQTSALAASANTTALQSALDSGERLLGLSGSLLLAQPLTIHNGISLVGSNMTLKLSDAMTFDSQGYRFFYANAIGDIEIAGVNFDGNKDNIAKHATNNTVIWLQDCINATIKDCVASNFQGAGSNLNTAFAWVNQCDGGFSFNNAIRDGIGGAIFMQGPRSLVQGNRAYNLQDIALVFNTASCYDSAMLGNRTTNCQGGGIGVENGPYSIAIEGNNIGDTQNGYGIAVLAIGSIVRSKDITVTGNTVRGNGGTNPCNGIAMVNVDDYLVDDNTIRGINTGNTNNSGLLLYGADWVASNNKVHVDCYGAIVGGSDFDIVTNQLYSTNQVGVIFPNAVSNVNVSLNRVKAGVCFQANSTISGQFLDNIPLPFGSSPVKYALGNVGYATSLKLRDSMLLGFGNADGVQVNGVISQNLTLAANTNNIVAIDFPGKPWATTVSWGIGNANIAGLVVAWDSWANGGQTAVFRIHNATGASLTLTNLYYQLFGQKTQASTV